jgi:hypothetical protein
MGRHEELVHVPGIYRETALLQLMDLEERAGVPEAVRSGHDSKALEEAVGRQGRLV